MDFAQNAILVVDDDTFQTDLITLQLNALGYRNVLRASGGQDALQQFDQQRSAFFLVISDLSMPDMDGLALMTELAKRGYAGGLILFSGMQDVIISSAGLIAKAHGLQLLGCLQKPIELQQLQRLIDQSNRNQQPLVASN